MTRHIPDHEAIISDPDKQPGVILDVPAGLKPIELLDAYQAAYPVRCSFCRQRQSHYRGFLALLEDGSRALCGHECAEHIGGKATVAALERTLERRLKEAEGRAVAAAVTAGVPEILAILDRDVMPVHRKAERVLRRLEKALPRAVETSAGSRLGFARGGLQRLLKARNESLTDRQVEDLLKVRARVAEEIPAGLDELEKAMSFLHPSNLKKEAGRLRHAARAEEVEVKGEVVRVMREVYSACLGGYYWHQDALILPRLAMPDRGPIMRAIEAMRA